MNELYLAKLQHPCNQITNRHTHKNHCKYTQHFHHTISHGTIIFLHILSDCYIKLFNAKHVCPHRYTLNEVNLTLYRANVISLLDCWPWFCFLFLDFTSMLIGRYSICQEQSKYRWGRTGYHLVKWNVCSGFSFVLKWNVIPCLWWNNDKIHKIHGLTCV